jgi:hypothetical protein
MDVAFAPLNSKQDVFLRRVLELRTNTKRVTTAGVVTVEELIADLPSNSNVTVPFDNVLLGSHASHFEIYLPLTRQQAIEPDVFEHTTFEIAARVANANPSPVKFPDTLFVSTTDGRIHFKGCNVGRDRPDTSRIASAPVPFLAKLRKAFGDTVRLTAPKHFHGIVNRTVVNSKTGVISGLGMFEFMAYEFSVRTKTRFKKTADLVQAFKDAHLKLIDGSEVPPEKWATWLIKGINGTTTIKFRPSLGTTIGTQTTLEVEGQLDVDVVPFPWDATFEPSDFPEPANYLAEFKDNMKGAPEFDPASEFPFYERWGYPSFDAFFDGLVWNPKPPLTKVKPPPPPTILRSLGTRVEYTLRIPITDPTSGNLLFNFFPSPSSIASAFVGMPETDARLYAEV